MFRSPIFFDTPDDGGSGAPVEAPAEQVVDAAIETPETAETTEVETTTPDWGTRITEWGGEEAIQHAIELDRAMQTREGVAALIEEGGKALYGSDPAKAALLQQLLGQTPAEAAPDPLAELMSDPDRLLSPTEVAEIVDTKVKQAIESVLGEHIQPLEERQAQEAAAAVGRSIDNAMTQLEVPTDVQDAVLQYADRHIAEHDLADPAKVREAIRQGYADYQVDMEKRVKAYLEGKKQVAETHPKVMKTGSAPGSVEPSEPKSVEEAIARVRESVRSRA